MPVNWKAPQAFERLLAAVVAAQDPKLDYRKIATYYGRTATYDAIEGRFRLIRREAAQLKAEIESGARPEAPARNAGGTGNGGNARGGGSGSGSGSNEMGMTPSTPTTPRRGTPSKTNRKKMMTKNEHLNGNGTNGDGHHHHHHHHSQREGGSGVNGYGHGSESAGRGGTPRSGGVAAAAAAAAAAGKCSSGKGRERTLGGRVEKSHTSTTGIVTPSKKGKTGRKVKAEFEAEGGYGDDDDEAEEAEEDDDEDEDVVEVVGAEVGGGFTGMQHGNSGMGMGMGMDMGSSDMGSFYSMDSTAFNGAGAGAWDLPSGMMGGGDAVAQMMVGRAGMGGVVDPFGDGMDIGV